MPGPRFIKVQDQEDARAALEVDKKPPLVVANWMYANAIHLIDYFSILGRGDISAVTPVVPWTPASPGIVVAHIQFTSGDIGLYEAVWNGPAPWAVTVCTQQDRLEMRPVEAIALQMNGSRQATPLEIEDIDRTFKPGLYFQAQQLVRAARGDSYACLATIDDALASMKLAAQIYQLDN